MTYPTADISREDFEAVMGLLAEYSPKLERAIAQYGRRRMAIYYALAIIYAALMITLYIFFKITYEFHIDTEGLSIVPLVILFFVMSVFFVVLRRREARIVEGEISRLGSALRIVYEHALTFRETKQASLASRLNFDLRIIEAEIVLREASGIVGARSKTYRNF